MKIESGVEQLVREIRRSRSLPKKPGLLKYDFGITLTPQREAVLAVVMVIPLFSVLVLADIRKIHLSGWLFFVYFAFILVIGFLSDWLWLRYRQPFILLTPTHLIAAYGWRPRCFEWNKIDELGLEAELRTDSTYVRAEDWPIEWTDKDLAKREFAHMLRSDKKGLDMTIEARQKLRFEQYALQFGNRQLLFRYDGKKCAVEIPAGADIQTLAKFVNQYWTKLNPGAKKKGVIYL